MSGHHRSLPLYCVIGADALSRAGNAMTTIAIPLIVLNQGYSAAEVGLSSAAASLPIVIGALAGGSFADRVGYRTTSVISDAASVVVSLASPDMALYINAVCFLISIAVTLLMVPSDVAIPHDGCSC